MNTPVELVIEVTQKGFHPAERWQRCDRQRHTFETVAAARKYLKDTYGNSKRVPMFCDRENGPSFQCGYVIGFRNADYSHAPVVHWLEQHWIEFRTVGAPIDLKAV